MSTQLDQNFQLAEESTYGTFVAPTRAFEAKGDDFKREQEDLPSVGMRPGMQGKGSDRLKTIEMGATGTLTFDVLNKGFGLLLQAMLGTASGPTVVTGAAYQSTFATATSDPGLSFSCQMQRVDTGDTLRPFSYLGCVVTGWKLSHAVGGLLEAEINFDGRQTVTSESAAAATSPASASTYDWTQLTATIGGSEFCIEDMELSADLGMKTDRRLMCSGGGLKKQPRRNAVPTITGALNGEFEDLTEYNLWTAGTLSEIVFTWTGEEILSGHNYSITVTLPNCKFTGDANPVSSLDDITKQPMPFEAFYDQSSAMCTIVYKSTDTSL